MYLKDNKKPKQFAFINNLCEIMSFSGTVISLVWTKREAIYLAYNHFTLHSHKQALEIQSICNQP